MTKFNSPILVPKIGTPSESYSEHILVYAKSDGKLYRKGTTGEVEVAEVNNTATASNMVLYVNAATGSDTTGDGSSGSPWKTLEFALKSIPRLVSVGNIKINFAAGVYTVTDYCLILLSEFLLYKNLTFVGSLGTVRSDFTAQTAVADNPFKRQVVGATFTENQYMGYCARHDNTAPTYTYSPIGPHGPSDLSAALHPEGRWTGAIMSYDTQFIFASNKSPKGLFGTAALKFQDCRITPSLNADFVLSSISVCSIIFSNCRIDTPTNYRVRLIGRLSISDCIFLTANTTAHAVSIEDVMESQISSIFIAHSNPSVSSGNGLQYSQATSFVYRCYIYGFAYGIEFDGNVNLLTKYGHYPNVIENVGCCFRLIHSNARLMFGESYGDHKLYLLDVNYVFALQGSLDGIHFVFDGGRLAGDASPLLGWFVPSTGGTWQGNATKLTALRSKPERYQDSVRGVSFYYPGLFPEVDKLFATTLANSGSGSIDVGDSTMNDVIEINYRLRRGSLVEKGVIILTGLNDTEISRESYFGPCGITFGKSVSGNTIQLTWVDSLSNGTDCLFSADISRVMVG